MTFELKIRNIVLIGAFSPLEFDKFFFVTKNIISENQIQVNSMFLTEFVQLITPSFHLTINNFQIIINAINPETEDSEISKILINILKSSKNLKIGGSGINFNWFLGKNNDINSLPALSKTFCFNSGNKVQNTFFDQADATFGFYSSKNILNTRLKLDVKPMIFKQIGKIEEESALQFEFNFHKDYKEVEKADSELIDLLNNYSNFRNETVKILEVIK